jgi:molybdenum cofactor cytidylyltransferase
MPSTLQRNEIFENNKIAAVILAAGQSNRFGQPKQLLDFKGKPFIERIIETALEAQLSPIVVVLGSDHELIMEAIKKYKSKTQILLNEDWKLGQSSSLRVAIDFLKNKCNAALFFLSDQPQIPVELVKKIKEEYFRHPAKIIAPYVNDRRGNPVLFDEACFSRLKEGSGDRGGRFLFKEIEPKRVQWDDPRILIDVDIPEEYKLLKEAYGQE